MPRTRPYTLTIAGFDPSGGAGLNADIKTFEAIKVYGLSVCTGITNQTESEFEKVEWTNEALVHAQIKLIMRSYPVEYCKIGMIENMEILSNVISLLKELKPGITIVWDPILSTSTGFDLEHDISGIKNILNEVFLVTPNQSEFEKLYGAPFDPDKFKNPYTSHVYLKGGHNKVNPGKDYLITDKVYPFNPKPGNYSSKHGSGCILSAALTGYMAKGYPLQRAALKAKRYVEQSLKSNQTLLAWHKR